MNVIYSSRTEMNIESYTFVKGRVEEKKQNTDIENDSP